MASYHATKYYCRECKEYMHTKSCPKCKTKNKPIPPYFVRCRWFDKNGEEINKKLTNDEWTSQSLAEKGYHEWLKENPSNQRRVEGEINTFEELYEEYLKHIELNMKESSYLVYKQRIDDFAKEHFAGRKIREITPLDITQWQNKLSSADKNLSYKYKTAIRSALYHLFDFATLYNFDNPLKKVKGFKNTDKRKEMLFWTEEEFLSFIQKVEDLKYKTLFSFFYLTGCRRGEVLALIWGDIDFDNRLVNIDKSITKSTDKKRKRKKDEKVINGMYRVTTPKTKNSYRKIPLPINLIDLLKAYKDSLKDFSSDWFIFGDDRNMPFTTLANKFDEYIALAEIKRIRIHDMRHSHVSLLINKGDNQLSTIYVIAKRLGDTVEQIFKTYGHMFPSSHDDLLTKLEIKISV